MDQVGERSGLAFCRFLLTLSHSLTHPLSFLLCLATGLLAGYHIGTGRASSNAMAFIPLLFLVVFSCLLCVYRFQHRKKKLPDGAKPLPGPTSE